MGEPNSKQSIMSNQGGENPVTEVLRNFYSQDSVSSFLLILVTNTIVLSVLFIPVWYRNFLLRKDFTALFWLKNYLRPLKICKPLFKANRNHPPYFLLLHMTEITTHPVKMISLKHSQLMKKSK